MALRSNASTTSLMNDARSPSGNHSRMSGGNNNRWSCEYGRKRWLMSHTLLARATLTQHFQSDRLLGVSMPAMEVTFRGQRLPALGLDKLVPTPEIFVQEVFDRWMESEVHESLVPRQDILDHVPVSFVLLVAVEVVPSHPLQAHRERLLH